MASIGRLHAQRQRPSSITLEEKVPALRHVVEIGEGRRYHKPGESKKTVCFRSAISDPAFAGHSILKRLPAQQKAARCSMFQASCAKREQRWLA